MHNEIIEVDTLILCFSTKDYYCVSTEEDTFGEEAERIFLSKEYVTQIDDTTFSMPEWYAINKGLV